MGDDFGDFFGEDFGEDFRDFFGEDFEDDFGDFFGEDFGDDFGDFFGDFGDDFGDFFGDFFGEDLDASFFVFPLLSHNFMAADAADLGSTSFPLFPSSTGLGRSSS